MKLNEYGVTASEIKEKVSKYMIELGDRFDFVAERGEGCYVYDAEGTQYLDFYAGIAVNSVGHCNENVVKAVCEQAATLMHTFNYPYTIPQALLAEKICTTIGMDKIYYENSGAESNEAMIKLARKYGVEKYGPNKYEIITARQSFHGRTLGAVTATGQVDSAIQKGFGDLVPGFKYADFNDLKSFEDAITENTIGIMVEPVQGEGGVRPATVEFLQGLRKLCDEKDILLLLDEVQTGWCRTGSVMAFMDYNVKPDIVSMAKAMGSGMPIGAICTTDKVAPYFTKGCHGTTYGGHPVSCAASYAGITQLLELKCAENAKEVGTYFAEELAKLPCVKEVRHKGLLVGVEFDGSILATALKHKCCENKLLVTAIGDTIIRMVPPLIITKEDCDEACAIIKKSIGELL